MKDRFEHFERNTRNALKTMDPSPLTPLLFIRADESFARKLKTINWCAWAFGKAQPRQREVEQWEGWDDESWKIAAENTTGGSFFWVLPVHSVWRYLDRSRCIPSGEYKRIVAEVRKKETKEQEGHREDSVSRDRKLRSHAERRGTFRHSVSTRNTYRRFDFWTPRQRPGRLLS